MSAAGGATLVTGAAGFIGRRVVAHLEASGAEVVAVGHRWGSTAELAAQVGAASVGRAIHLGWYSDPSDCMTNEAENAASFCSAVELVTHLLGRARLAGSPVPHVVLVGSWWELAYPHSAYGRLKARLARLATEGLSPVGMRWAWARLQTVVGPGEHPGRVLPTVARALAAGQPVDLSPGAQVRDYLDVDDAAAALCSASSYEVEGVYDVGTGSGTTLGAMCREVAAQLGAPESLLRFGARPYIRGECMEAVADPGPLARATGWRARLGPVEVARRIAGRQPSG